MAAELPRPGVEVIQVFRTASPTVVTPTLVPAVVGVAKQVVELLVDDGAGGQELNSDALITLPAFFIASPATGTPAVYSGLDGETLIFSPNGGPNVTITFADSAASGLTPASVVQQINEQLATANVTSVVAEVLGTTQFLLRTIAVGEFASIKIQDITVGLPAASLSAFGLGDAATGLAGKTFFGVGLYDQYITEIPEASFPDPRNNLSELAIEGDSVRAFLATGNALDLREVRRDKAFCRNGVVADSAAVVMNVDLTTLIYPGAVQGDTLIFTVDGGASQTVTIASNPANAAALMAELDTLMEGVTASVDGSDFALFVADSNGNASSISITGGTLLADIHTGTPAAPYNGTGKNIEAIDDGNGDAVTPLILFENRSEDGAATDTAINFDATPTAAAVTGSAAMSLPPAAGETLVMSDGNRTQTLTFDGTEAAAADVVNKINAIWGAGSGGNLLASEAAGTLTLTHLKTGTDSVIHIVSGTSLAATLDPGGTPTIVAGFFRGVVSKPKVADELWIDGVFFGTIVEVHPGGQAGVLKVDKNVPVSLVTGSTFFIEAANLPDSDASRPRGELVVNTGGDVSIKQELLRDTQGNRTSTKATVYLSYTAVRQDVTSIAAQPGLLTFDDTTQLEAALAPLNTDNPLGLGLFFALINAPGVQVSGLGVDAVSADFPFGTLEAFTRAAEYLEAFEVYAIAPLSHQPTVHQVFQVHVDSMSEAENKGERVVLINPKLPTRKLDTLVASGTDGDELTTTTFDTKIANLSALVLNKGVDPTGTILATAGLFLDIASDSKSYSISAISGSVVTIRTTFATGENDDGFYATTDFSAITGTLISESFSVKVRGASLTTTTGTPDNNGISETIQGLGQTYLDRRVWMVVPDQAQAPVGGLETIVNGFYMAAAIAGMIGQNPPEQSFTNFPMVGFTTVIGSNDRFNNRQLNVMAAGGAYIVVQDVQGGPLTSRFALTTDLTSIETRTDSITKVVDFTAKFLRAGIRNFIGRFNITQGFLDTLGNVLQGLGGFLVENGTLIGFSLNNIIQDEDAPDTVLVDITLDVPFPANFIRLTLVV